MNELMIFNNPEFGEIRTIEEDGKVLFCGSDVAKALGYAKPQNAIDRHCKGALKRGIPHPQSPDKTIEMNFIPEGDIYRLAAKSELPGAEAHGVPAIQMGPRKRGYETDLVARAIVQSRGMC